MGLRLAAALTALVVLALIPPARAADLSGTWRGTVDGHQGPFTTAFSEDGYVLFEYTNHKGSVRTVELTAPGQIRFVPPDGGVTTVAVNSVVKRPDGVSYVLHIGFERAGSGYPDHRAAPLRVDESRLVGAGDPSGDRILRRQRRIDRRPPESGGHGGRPGEGGLKGSSPQARSPDGAITPLRMTRTGHAHLSVLARPIGDGFYGVDIKEIDHRWRRNCTRRGVQGRRQFFQANH
jgi:hypothetical protein